MKIKYYSHASFQFIGNRGTRLLSDPWVYNPICNMFWQYPACQIALEEYQSQDILYISHDHADHLCLKTLQHFPRTLPIVIRDYGEINNPVKPQLLKAGFKQLIELKDGESQQFQELTLSLFTDPNTSDSALVIQDEVHTVFNQNDCMLPLAHAETIGRRFQIDLALLFTSSASMYPTLFEMPETQKRHETALRNEKVMQRALQYARALKARWVTPCAGDMVRFRDLKLNLYAGSLPCEFKAFMAEQAPDIPVITPAPSDIIDLTAPDPDLRPLFNSRSVWSEQIRQLCETPDMQDFIQKLKTWEDSFSLDEAAFWQQMQLYTQFVQTHFSQTFPSLSEGKIAVRLSLTETDSATLPAHDISLDFEQQTASINTAQPPPCQMHIKIPAHYLAMVMAQALNFDDLRAGMMQILRPGPFSVQESGFWHFLSRFAAFHKQETLQEAPFDRCLPPAQFSERANTH